MMGGTAMETRADMTPVGGAEGQARGTAMSAIGAELLATLALAAPLAAANLAQIAMGVTDSVMVGRLGALPLAAAGLGGMLYFSGGITLQGILSAVAPLAAQALGAGDRAAAGRIAGAGLTLALLLALPFAAALTGLHPMLRALGYDPALAGAIGRFLRAIAWGAPAFLGFAVLRGLLAALSRPRSVMVVLVVCVAGNAALNWVLIWGHLGAPALGVAGSGYASAINQWLIVAGLVLCVRRLPGVGLLGGVIAARRIELSEILRLGLPIGGIMGIELGFFLAAGILIGLLGAAALGAHQLVLSCASVTFMVPLGLGQAATVRVAYERGAGRAVAARGAGFVAIALGIWFMSAAAVVLWTFPRAIIAAYVDTADPGNRALVETARRLLTIAAVFQVFDGIQTIAAGALRGHRDTLVPMLLAATGYWGVGFLGGWIFAFPLGYGAVGLWWGFALGLAVVAALLTLRLCRLASPRHRAAEAIALQ
jgi:MATE family multidrug resistance protein